MYQELKKDPTPWSEEEGRESNMRWVMWDKNNTGRVEAKSRWVLKSRDLDLTLGWEYIDLNQVTYMICNFKNLLWAKSGL